MKTISIVLTTMIAANLWAADSTKTTINKPKKTVLDTLWIDVRTPTEYSAGHISGSTNLPLDQIEAKFSSLVPNKSQPVVLYCRSGNRSGQALRLVSEMGYTKAVNGGGFAALSQTRPSKVGSEK